MMKQLSVMRKFSFFPVRYAEIIFSFPPGFASHWTQRRNWRLSLSLSVLKTFTSRNYQKRKNRTRPRWKKRWGKIREPRDRKQYLENCYKNNEEKFIDQIQDNDNDESYYRRLIREIDNGLIDIKPLEHQQLKNTTLNLMKKLINIFLNDRNNIFI